LKETLCLSYATHRQFTDCPDGIFRWDSNALCEHEQALIAQSNRLYCMYLGARREIARARLGQSRLRSDRAENDADRAQDTHVRTPAPQKDGTLNQSQNHLVGQRQRYVGASMRGRGGPGLEIEDEFELCRRLTGMSTGSSSRYDTTATSFAAAVHLAATFIALR
jgi:hypothetical protein